MPEPGLAAPLALRPGALRFGRFELQPLERRLLVDGQAAALGARAFDLLLALAAQPGTLLTKHQLLEAVWPGVVVEENNLTTQISTLRKAMGGDVIVTIPGRGYRFAARSEAPAGAQPAPRPSALSSATPPPPASKVKTNLPSDLPGLLGRAEDLAALGELIVQHRLVSIVGAGGMGKSLLTQHLLDGQRSAYAHGVCWVEMVSVSDPSDLPGVLAVALGLQTGGGDALAGLANAVAPLQMLVALDNAEQVLDGVACLAAALLAAAPGLRLVVTSQAPLKLAQELVYRIGPLAVPQGPLPAAEALRFSAVALFAERARLADARFVLTDANAPAVIELCRALDGLALAIELAAARAPMLGVQRLAASMHDRLRLLTSSRNRAAPARQQTLRAAMEWSHGFLDERERAVFRRLAVFVGSASLTMIQQVAADPPGEGESGEAALDEWAVLDALALLVDRSLVTVLTADDVAEPRYRLLDSPRAYALERLKDAGETAALRQRHLRAMAAFCEAAWHAHYSGEVGREDWHRGFERDADNAREAFAATVAAGDRVAALQIGAAMLTAVRNVPIAKQLELADLCVGLIDAAVPPALQMRVWLQISFALAGGRPGRVLEATRKALDVLQQFSDPMDDRFLAYWAWCRFAMAAFRSTGDTPEVRSAMEEARALEDPRWPPQRRHVRAEAEMVTRASESQETLRWCREVLALMLEAGDSGDIARANLIDAELRAEDAQAAVRNGEALLADLSGGRNAEALAFTRLNLCAALLALDDAPRARSHARTGWPQGRLFEIQPDWAVYLALMAAQEARPRAAARLAGYADAGYAARKFIPQPNEANAHDRACTLAHAALGDAEFERRRAEGRLLRDEQIEAIAFATADD